MIKNKFKRKHQDNSIVSFVVLITTTIAFIAISSMENINTIALVLACIAFLGAVLNTLYVRTSDYEEKRRSRREKLEAIKLIDQQNDGLNTVKDSITLLKLMSKQQQELYKNNPDIKTLVLCNTEMLSVVVDVLEKLSKRRYR